MLLGCAWIQRPRRDETAAIARVTKREEAAASGGVESNEVRAIGNERNEQRPNDEEKVTEAGTTAGVEQFGKGYKRKYMVMWPGWQPLSTGVAERR